MNDQEYLEMANHCKEVVEQKETLISFYKEKLVEIEDDLRKMEYKVKQVEHLLKFKEKEATNHNKKIFNFLLDDVAYLYKIIDKSRCNCNVDEEDEEIVLMLQTNLE